MTNKVPCGGFCLGNGLGYSKEGGVGISLNDCVEFNAPITKDVMNPEYKSSDGYELVSGSISNFYLVPMKSENKKILYSTGGLSFKEIGTDNISYITNIESGQVSFFGIREELGANNYVVGRIAQVMMGNIDGVEADQKPELVGADHNSNVYFVRIGETLKKFNVNNNNVTQEVVHNNFNFGDDFDKWLPVSWAKPQEQPGHVVVIVGYDTSSMQIGYSMDYGKTVIKKELKVDGATKIVKGSFTFSYSFDGNSTAMFLTDNHKIIYVDFKDVDNYKVVDFYSQVKSITGWNDLQIGYVLSANDNAFMVISSNSKYYLYVIANAFTSPTAFISSDGIKWEGFNLTEYPMYNVKPCGRGCTANGMVPLITNSGVGELYKYNVARIMSHIVNKALFEGKIF